MDIEQSQSELNRTDGGDYRIEVRDFGSIEYADVEFRPLTVFVGPSNTGKSYLATLSYALHRYFAGEPGPLLWSIRRHLGGVRDHRHALDRESDEMLTAELASWAATVTEDRDLPGIPARVAEAVRREIERGDHVAGPLEEEVVRSFGADNIKELVRRSGSGAAEVVVGPSRRVDQGLLGYRLRMARDQVGIEGNASVSSDLFTSAESTEVRRWKRLAQNEALRYQALESEEPVDDRKRTLHLRRIIHHLVELARQPTVGALKRQAYYLPADRTGIMHSHKMVVAALVQRAATAGLRRTLDVPMLSGVLTDFLEELIQMGDRNGPKRGRRINSRVASELEEAVLGGTVRIEPSETNYPQFLYRPQGWNSDLPLMRSSSMVSELTPLVLFLRHVVGPGDVLIIEEPESHLHPAMQVEVIEWVGRVVRAGVRVIVTTHSEWILEGLANIVQASQIVETDGPTDDHGTFLHPWEVGTWRFRPGKAAHGVIVEEIKIDDEGMYPSGFDEVAVGLHNRWAESESQARQSD